MNEIETALCQINNFQFIHEHLFTSGQPTAEQLKLIKEYGISTIINVALSNAEPHLDHEDKICLELDSTISSCQFHGKCHPMINAC